MNAIDESSGSLTPRAEVSDAGASRWAIFAWAVVLAMVCTLGVMTAGTHQLGAYWDDASYVVLARSLVDSPEYGHISYPGDPLPTRYPFGYPLLLALVASGARSLGAMTAVSLVATLVNLTVLFWAWPSFCRGYSRWWSVGAVAIASLSPLVTGHTDMVMSEPVFTTLALLTLASGARCASRPLSWTWPLLLGALSAYAICLRTIGAALPLAIALSLVIQLRGQAMRSLATAAAAGLGTFAVLVLATNVTVRDIWPGTYLQHSSLPTIGDHSLPFGTPGLPTEPVSLLSRVTAGGRAYLEQHIRTAIVPVGGGDREVQLGKSLFGIENLPAAIGLTVTALVFLGAVVALRRQSGLLPGVLLFEACYLAVLFNWPWNGARFLYPIQPFLAFHFLSGVAAVVSVLPLVERVTSRRRIAAVATAAVCVGLAGAGAAKSLNAPDGRGHLPDLEVGARWLRENAATSAVVMARNPDSVFVHAERKVLDYPLAFELAPFRDQLDKHRVDFVLVTPELWWRDDGQLAYDEVMARSYVPMLEALEREGRVTSVFRSDRDLVEVFEVVRDRAVQVRP